MREDQTNIEMPVPCVDQLELLGTVLHRTGSTVVALEHRLEKAEIALRIHHDILFNHAASLKSRFRDLSAESFPF